jgi:ribose/xylose/arabinose/galactoside ABC-type transport system permease subunit
MMLRGWRLRFTTDGANTTYCPGTMDDFMKQRRRWNLSGVANSLTVLRNMRSLIKNNSCFSLVYCLYLLQLFSLVVLAPGSTIAILAIGLDLLLELPFTIVTSIMTYVLLVYVAICCQKAPPVSPGVATKLLTAVFGVTSVFVVVGIMVLIARDLVKGTVLTHIETGLYLNSINPVLLFVKSTLINAKPTKL